MTVSWNDLKGSASLDEGAIFLTSFPSAGFATTVAAHYIVRSLGLPRLGTLDDPEGTPVAVVSGGHVQAPIRVYGKGRIAVIVSELPLVATSPGEIAHAILDGAQQRKAGFVLALEGVVPHPTVDDGGETEAPVADEHVWFVASDENTARSKTFTSAGVRPLQEAVLGGVAGALLVRGLQGSVPVGVLLVSARATEGYPDHRAGATLIEALDRIYPDLAIDTAPLRSQAEVIEKALRAALKAHQSNVDRQHRAAAEPTIYQ